MSNVAIAEAALRVVVFLFSAYALAIVVLFGAALLRGLQWKKKASLKAELQPQIRSSLVDYLAGNDDLAPFRSFLIIGQAETANTMLSFQDAVAGSARDRLCALALHLELLDDWRRAVRSRDIAQRRVAFAGIAFVYAYEACRRAVGSLLVAALGDSDREVRVCAAQALARFGSQAEVELVFHMAIRGNLATRVQVAGPLRTHALELSRSAVAEALRSGDAMQILATLEMVVTWERALPLAGLADQMRHRERAIRIQALHAAPLAPASDENASGVMESLDDPDPEIAMAAAAAAGRLRILAALPSLVHCCLSGNAAIARTSAAAMADLGPQGWSRLKDLAAGGSDVPAGDAGAGDVAARAAAEALARVRAAGGA